LTRLRSEGFTQGAIEAAVNTIEFSLRENNTGRFPRGLSLMLRAMSAWIYDQDPLRPLRWQDDLEKFKGRLASGEDVFGPLLDKFLLNNGHRITVELLPDEKLGEKIETAEKERLEAARAALDAAGLEIIARQTHELKDRQETPDAPEALACVPTLQVNDIPRKASTVPTAITDGPDGVKILTHDLFTNDVLYIDVALDLKPVPVDLLPLVPLFCRCLTQMGTEKEGFVELTERIGRKTGGLGVSPFVSSLRGKPEAVGYVTVS
jgi:presequence protease